MLLLKKRETRLTRTILHQVSTSKALPGFLRGAMDRYSLKRVATETRGEHSLGEWGVPTSTEEVMEQASLPSPPLQLHYIRQTERCNSEAQPPRVRTLTPTTLSV